MPVVQFQLRWPDGRVEVCSSPSTAIEEHLAAGRRYQLEEFLARAREGLEHASRRVAERFGFACSAAAEQLAALERTAEALGPEHRRGWVAVLAMERQGAGPAPSRGRRGHAPASERTEVVVVGGGQAGLSMSWHLRQRGIEHLVLEAHTRGHVWRTERWDSFCLVTPNWQCRLPGFPYAGDDPDGFMGREQIVAYLDAYAASFDPPLREGVRVEAVRAEGTGFALTTSRGPLRAQQVVIATGGYGRPRLPAAAAQLSPRVVQLHSARYRRPAQLPEGEVLVVGTGQSGCQIAEDLHLAGRRVHLSVGGAPRCARRHRGRDVVEWLERMGHYDLPIEEHPDGEAARESTNHYVTGRDGGHDLDLRRFALEGMRLYGPLHAAAGERLRFEPGLRRNLDAADDTYRRINRSIDEYIAREGLAAPPPGPEYAPPWEPGEEVLELDCAAAGIGAVVWCTGFETDLRWIELPVLDARGLPRHRRGITAVPGLYFLGLPWLHTWGSGRFAGVGRDAGHLAARIEEALVARRAGGGGEPSGQGACPELVRHM
jgi:putative flavoprotein involved in K+ transport